MRQLIAVFVLASTVSLTAAIPSASAQGVGFFQPPFNTGLTGCTNLNGVNQALFPTLPQPVIGVQQCPLGFGVNGGVNGTGQLSAQAVPVNGGLGFGLNNIGLNNGIGGIGFGGIGGLTVNPPGFGFGNPLGFGVTGGVNGFGTVNGLGGTGQLSAQAFPTNNAFGGGLGAFGGLGFGLGGINPPGFGLGNPLGFGVTGGVTGIGTGLGGNCIPLGGFIVCQ